MIIDYKYPNISEIEEAINDIIYLIQTDLGIVLEYYTIENNQALFSYNNIIFGIDCDDLSNIVNNAADYLNFVETVHNFM